MAVQKLAKDIRSLVSASITINSFKTAVEELVYNALDADSTSIAVRINIIENTIQVIDNGSGISKTNFPLLGQRYATSKCVSLENLKSAPNKYGFKGQFLSSLTQVSRSVKVISRTQDTAETWCKCFDNGQETESHKSDKRPSKGTTVEVKDFLYNLNIRKSSVNTLQELRDIKTFLEQLSIVHSNVSISLRDDSNNDIIFKIHKKRDIYQTLSTIFDVEKTDVQELIVEKNQYKATAYIGKRDKATQRKHWIYVNGKFTQNVNLHKTVNDYFVKTLNLKHLPKRNVKSKTIRQDEETVPSNCEIPFYVILITCPYYDYDISYTPEHSMLEFRNWECVSKLLEKLVQFYSGDMKLKEVKDQNVIPEQPKKKVNETRDQVRKILEKMLDSTKRKPGISQMQNGIKGKPIKRRKKKTKSAIDNDAVLKVILPRKTKSDHIVVDATPVELCKSKSVAANCNVSAPILTFPSLTETKKINTKNVTISTKRQGRLKTTTASHVAKVKKVNRRNNKAIKKAKLKEDSAKHIQTSPKVESVRKCKPSKLNIENDTNDYNSGSLQANIKKKNDKITKLIPESETDKSMVKVDPLLEKFEKQTNSVKRKCEVLAKHVENLLNNRKKGKREVFVNETIQYRNIIQNNKSVSVCQEIEEIVIHDFVPRPASPCTFDDRNWKDLQKIVPSTTYDLLKPILTTQIRENRLTANQEKHQSFHIQKNYERHLDHSAYFEVPYKHEKVNPDNIKQFEKLTSTLLQTETKLTYESHHYGKYMANAHTNIPNNSFRKCPREFITTRSRDNFEVDDSNEIYRRDLKIGFKKQSHFQRNFFSRRKSLFNYFNNIETWNNAIEESGYTIEFSRDNEKNICKDICGAVRSSRPSLSQDSSTDCRPYGTYTIIEQSNTYDNNQNYFGFGETYTVTSKTSHEIQIRDQDHTTLTKECTSSPKTYVLEQTQDNFDKQGQEQDHDQEHGQEQENCCDKSVSNKKYIADCYKSELTEIKDNVNKITENEISVGKLHETENVINEEIDTLNVTATVQNQNQESNHSVSGRRLNDSLFNGEIDLDSVLYDRNIYLLTSSSDSRKAVESQNNFNKEINQNMAKAADNKSHDKNEDNRDKNETNQTVGEFQEFEGKLAKGVEEKVTETHNFNFKNRPRFLPKGLSPIFENCQTKTICNYELDKDYYEDSIYNNFVNDVKANIEIFESRVQNVKELATREIEKVNSRINKDNASLVFDGESLKNIVVLGQVDNKFIAAKIVGKNHQEPSNVKESLVLFDQHAVHERIRLERNLSDYFIDNQWKKVAVDEVIVKLSKEDILYLHNYRDKFMLFGLEWSMSDNCEVAITAIPEAVLGKNPRQADVIVGAVKNLIAEEIRAIKSQKGCVALYPKAIMELVFSEACRYAIKFGDRLSRLECQELLSALSECKTPFQCAHGRPVMAVLLDINRQIREYQALELELNIFCAESSLPQTSGQPQRRQQFPRVAVGTAACCYVNLLLVTTANPQKILRFSKKRKGTL